MEFSITPLFWGETLNSTTSGALGAFPPPPPETIVITVVFNGFRGGILRPKRKKVVLFGVFSGFSLFHENMRNNENMGK